MPNPQLTRQRSGRKVPNPQPNCQRSGFSGQFPIGRASVSGEAETHWKLPKRGENRRDLSLSVQDPVRSSRIWQRFCQIRCFFPPNRAQNRRIWCFGRRNLLNHAGKLVGKLELSRLFSFRVSWVERFLKEGTRNRTVGVGFWSSRPTSDHRSNRIGL